jgi:hypothetical protein
MTEIEYPIYSEEVDEIFYNMDEVLNCSYNNPGITVKDLRLVTRAPGYISEVTYEFF